MARSSDDVSPLERQLQSLRRLALAAARPGGPSLVGDLLRELAEALDVAAVIASLFEDGDRTRLRTFAARLDGQTLEPFSHPACDFRASFEPSREFRYDDSCAAPFDAETILGAAGMETCASYPLLDSGGAVLGLVAVMDRRPIAGGEVGHIESLLKIAAGRLAGEVEQQSARQALARSEANYRAIFDAAEDAIFIHDWDTGDILDVSPRACETFGWTREEFAHMPVDRLSAGTPPYTANDALRWIQLAKLDRCPPFEWHSRNKDGSLHWDEVRLKPVTIDGRPHVLAFARDVTERRAAVAAQLAQEQKYRAIFDGSVDAMVLWSDDLRVVDVNDAFVRLLGIGRERIVGRHWSERPDLEDMQRLLPRIRSALDGHVEQAMERVSRADGSLFDMELRYLPVRLGDARYALGVGRDVSERQRAEQALRDSEAHYRAIFNASADALVLRAADFSIVDVNATYEAMSGYARAEVLGVDRVLANPPEVAQTIRALHQRALGGETIGLETQLFRRDGKCYQLELRGMPITHRGEPHVLYIGRDITERHAAEHRRNELERQLRQAQKMEAIGQLTGGIAHDFNNILASVIGYIVLGQERAEALADATLTRQLGQAHLAADRARELIAQMLAFARRQRGERRVLALPALVHQTLSLLRATLPATVSLEDDAPPDVIGADASPPCVDADPVQLEQVLFNLCINARDAIRGEGRIVVTLRRADGGPAWHCASCRALVGEGRWVELAVEDDGPGIGPGLAERIFEPFYSTKAPGHGSGMGLAMVHGIVHDHGGHLRLSSAPGRGARFGVWLPLSDAAEAVRGAAAAAAAPLAPLDGRVLLVEDDRMVGNFLVERLAGWGLDVKLHRDALAASAWLDEPSNLADLLITDQTMPRLTGLQLAARARARRPNLPIVLVSGDATGFDADRLARAGIAAAISKPIDGERLHGVLRRLLPQAG